MNNNKRIAKNTFYLYIRMLFLLAISLYTSRIVLEALGVEDYGIYNIVGSIIILFSFINNALTGSTRRFINTEIGKANKKKEQEVFSASLTIHIGVSIIILFVAETIGLWFLNTQLNIPIERMYAANWVFQFSVISTCIGILSAPYEACIVAYERMSIYAYISIIDGILKLIIVYLLFLTSFDKLIFYSLLILSIGVITTYIKWKYCSKHFSICKYQYSHNKKLHKEIAFFSGWSVIGQISYVASNTGVNMAVNIFHGVTLNAAIGLAQQVNSAVYNFAANFQTAFNPQIIQTYASEKIDEFTLLIYRASKFSYYLIFIISLPLFINIDYILSIWLVNTPAYTKEFIQLMLVYSLIEVLNAPLWMGIQATGRIKAYQLTISAINILALPLSFIVLKAGYTPIIIYVIKLCTVLMAYIFRLYCLNSYISITINHYIKAVIAPILTITIISIIPAFILSYYYNGLNLLFYSIGLIPFCALTIFVSGLTTQEKSFLKRQIITKTKK